MSNTYERTERVEARQWLTNGPDTTAHAIVAWVNANRGEARYEPASEAQYGGAMLSDRPARIAVRTSTGWAYAAPSDWIVKTGLYFRADSGRSYEDVKYLNEFRIITAAEWNTMEWSKV